MGSFLQLQLCTPGERRAWVLERRRQRDERRGKISTADCRLQMGDLLAEQFADDNDKAPVVETKWGRLSVESRVIRQDERSFDQFVVGLATEGESEKFWFLKL